MPSEMSETGSGDREATRFLIDEALGFVYPGALRAVASMGVADLLADGPLTVADLARRTGADETAMRRVLRVLATRGIFEELADGRFGLTALGRPLMAQAPLSARPAVLMLTDPTLWRPAGEAERSLRKGGPAFEDIFGMTFFDYVARNEQTAAVFHTGMAAFSDQENEPIAAAYDFPESGLVIDVGGGHGGFMLEVLRRRPGLRGVLMDEEHVVAGHRLDTEEVKGRWRLAPGDFFAEVPAAGDVYLIKRVLHDWDDELCVTILRNCRQAVAPGGRILVIDAVIPPGNQPHQAKAVDMALMTVVPGRERTEAEFASLLVAAGLRLSRVIPTGTGVSIVEAVVA